MATVPRSFVARKQTPEIPVPASTDRNLNQFLQNARERINALESEITALKEAARIAAETADTTPSDPDAPAPTPVPSDLVTFPFSFGDASPAAIGSVSGTVIAASISILTAFDGTGAALAIGTAGTPSLVMGAADNLPSAVGRYETNPGVAVTETLFLTITPGTGATAGNGIVYLEIAS